MRGAVCSFPRPCSAHELLGWGLGLGDTPRPQRVRKRSGFRPSAAVVDLVGKRRWCVQHMPWL